MLTITAAEWNALIAAFLYPFVRILAWLSVDPLLGNKAAPRSVRVGLAMMLAVAVAPGLPPVNVPLVSGPGLILLLQQIAVGLAIGFAVKIVFAILEFAGQFMGLQMGLSLATLIDPINGAQTPVLAQFLAIAAVLILFAMDGHHLVIAALWNSFHTIPVAATMLSGHGFLGLVQWGGALFSAGLHIALPVTAALLVANLSIGMMTRAAPQLNIFAVGFPITMGAGFLMLYFTVIYLPANLERLWRQAVEAGSAAAQRMVGP